MAIYSGNVTGGSSDWTYDNLGPSSSTGDTTIAARRTRDGTGVLIVDDVGYANLDTSGIDAGWTINSATLKWYTHAYATTPKGDPESSSIQIYNTGGTWQEIEASSANRVVGWESYVLSSDERNHIRLTGETEFRFIMGNVVTSLSVRSWTIRSYEYATGNTNSVRLEVDYTEPSIPAGTRKRVIIIS